MLINAATSEGWQLLRKLLSSGVAACRTGPPWVLRRWDTAAAVWTTSFKDGPSFIGATAAIRATGEILVPQKRSLCWAPEEGFSFQRVCNCILAVAHTWDQMADGDSGSAFFWKTERSRWWKRWIWSPGWRLVRCPLKILLSLNFHRLCSTRLYPLH